MWLQPHSTSAQLQWLCHLPPATHLTQLHVASPFPCSRCNFIFHRAPLPLLQISLGSAVCTQSSLLPSLLSVFFLPFPSFLSLLLFSKKDGAKLKQSLPASDDLSLGKQQRKSFTAVMRCLAASYSLSPFSKNPVLLVCRVPGQQGGCSWRYIAVGRQPKPEWCGEQEV